MSDDVSWQLAAAEFRNDISDSELYHDISDLKQILDNKLFGYDVIKETLEQASQSNNVEFVERPVETTNDRLRT